MGPTQVGLLKSRLAEIPLWFPEGERFTLIWVDAFRTSVLQSLRARGCRETWDELPSYLTQALNDELQKLDVFQ